jgi:DNA (cytosine-5)-methyltransferase 1
MRDGKLTGLSLFSGIGGLDIAFEAAGGRIAAMCERDEFCRTILKKRWPGIPIFEDVFDMSRNKIKEVICGGEKDTKLGIDVIFGGFPCQGFSVAGRRKGKNDERYLWPECARLVREIKPAWCVFENVSGILTLAADDICADLENLGYSVGIWAYEAAAVGAPHRRMRVFFVAHAQSSGQ